jgi:hypothetical protein
MSRSRLFIASGLVALAASPILALIRVNLVLKLGNLTSRPDWARPVPTLYDQCILRLPIRALCIALFVGGLAMLVAGLMSRRTNAKVKLGH